MRKKRFNLENAKLRINNCRSANDVFVVICSYQLDYDLSDEITDKLIEFGKEKFKTFKTK